MAIAPLAKDLPLVIAARASSSATAAAAGHRPSTYLLADARVLARAHGRGRHRPLRVSDIVPIDYVGDGLLACLTTTRSGDVALVAGADAPTNAELIELACRQFGREPPRIVTSSSSRLPTRRSTRLLRQRRQPRDERARELLGPLGVSAPLLRDYFPT